MDVVVAVAAFFALLGAIGWAFDPHERVEPWSEIGKTEEQIAQAQHNPTPWGGRW